MQAPGLPRPNQGRPGPVHAAPGLRGMSSESRVSRGLIAPLQTAAGVRPPRLRGTTTADGAAPPEERGAPHGIVAEEPWGGGDGGGHEDAPRGEARRAVLQGTDDVDEVDGAGAAPVGFDDWWGTAEYPAEAGAAREPGAGAEAEVLRADAEELEVRLREAGPHGSLEAAAAAAAAAAAEAEAAEEAEAEAGGPSASPSQPTTTAAPRLTLREQVAHLSTAMTTATAAVAPAHVSSASRGSLPEGSLPLPSPPLRVDIAASPGRWATAVPSRSAAVAAAAGPQNWWAQSTAPRRRATAYQEVRIRHQVVVEGRGEDGQRIDEADGDEDDEAYVAPPSTSSTSGQAATLPSYHPTTTPSSSEATPSLPSAMQRLLQPLLSPLQPLLSRSPGPGPQ